MTDEVDRSDIDASKAPLLDHLIELRMRLMRGLAGTGLVLLCLLPFANKLYGLLAQPLLDKLPGPLAAKAGALPQGNERDIKRQIAIIRSMMML